MKVDDAMISRVATISRISLSEEEKRRFKKDLEDVLSAFSVLDELELKDTKSSFRPLEARNSLRDDKPSLPLSCEDALSFTEKKEDGFFIGPKTIG